MEWLNLHTSTLDAPEFIGAEPCQRATWLCLQRYCIGQENGGLIPACGDWPDRRWQQLCRITKREVNDTCELWRWNGSNLVVWKYPTEKEHEVKQNRTNGKLGGRPTGSKSVNPKETTRFDSAETEGKGREGKGKEGEGKASVSAAAPSLGRPADLKEVIAFFAELQAPEAEAATFFDHYEANGWKQGGRAVIKSWRSAAKGWVRRWRDGFGGGSGKKNTPGGGPPGGAPVVPFNPNQPHAHTGGLADMAKEGNA